MYFTNALLAKYRVFEPHTMTKERDRQRTNRRHWGRKVVSSARTRQLRQFDSPEHPVTSIMSVSGIC